MTLIDKEQDKWSVICRLVRDLANSHITKGYSSFEEMCIDIQSATKIVWPDNYSDILGELRVCTQNTRNRIDYQQLFVESLRFPYTRPAIKSPEGKDLFEVFGKLPSLTNETHFEEGTITKIKQDSASLSLICFIPKTQNHVSEETHAVLGDFLEIKCIGIDGVDYNKELIPADLESIYEVPMIDYYKKLYGIKSTKDCRCIFIDAYNENALGYILFDRLKITRLQTNVEIHEYIG